MIIEKLFNRMGLRAKIIVAITFVIILTTIVGSGFFYARTKAMVYDNLRKHGEVICKNLSYSAKYGVLTEDVVVLDELVKSAMEVEDVAYVLIQDEEGKVLSEQIFAGVIYLDTLKKRALQSKMSQFFRARDKFSNEIYNFSTPIISKTTGLGEIGAIEQGLQEETSMALKGVVMVGVSLSNASHKLRNVLGGIIALTAVIVSIGVLFSYALTRIIMKPIEQMAEATVKVAYGDLSQKLTVESNDEIGQFAEHFNSMTKALKERKEQLQQSYKELAVSEQRYRVFVQNSSEVIWCFERKDSKPYPIDVAEDEMVKQMFSESIVVECNDTMAILYGFEKRQEVINRPLGDFVSQNKTENLETFRSFVRNNYNLLDVETEQHDGHGNMHIMVNNMIGITGNGRLLRVWVIQRDVTESKRAEQIQLRLFDKIKRANRDLQDFAYITSHDLKAPLRGIKTLAEWISSDHKDTLNEQGKEHMDLLLTRVNRMHNLIDGILQYSRVGRVREKQVQVNLNNLLPEVIDMVSPPENISITIESALPTITCEQTRIAQIFQNLLSNSVKYMDKPEGQISVGCVEEDGFWKFNVTDNGPGVEEKYQEKIFRIFQTLAPRDEYESTGIGLTLVKKIVELYGGSVWIESKPGEGSTFFFTLPITETEIKNERYQANIAS